MTAEIEHAYPFYQTERAFLERAMHEHIGVVPDLALGLLEATELYATQAQGLRELVRNYKELANDATTGKGCYGGHPDEWTARRRALANESARLGVDNDAD
jgi:hypothetical protein